MDLSILTNGVIWLFYLISSEGGWQKKWFLSIDFLKQKSDHIVSQLFDLLTKDNQIRILWVDFLRQVGRGNFPPPLAGFVQQ